MQHRLKHAKLKENRCGEGPNYKPSLGNLELISCPPLWQLHCFFLTFLPTYWLSIFDSASTRFHRPNPLGKRGSKHKYKHFQELLSIQSIQMIWQISLLKLQSRLRLVLLLGYAKLKSKISLKQVANKVVNCAFAYIDSRLFRAIMLFESTLARAEIESRFSFLLANVKPSNTVVLSALRKWRSKLPEKHMFDF